jgi:nucleoside-diphosphate-sugar epimerase
MSKGVIITGADGFIGSHTVELFLAKGYRVLALDVPVKPNRLSPHPNLVYMHFDMMLCNEYIRIKNLIDTFNEPFDYFIHFAWYGSAGEKRKVLTEQLLNVNATNACIELASDAGCKKFVCAGSLMEYEVERATHYDGPETSTNYYGLAKLAAHYSAKQRAKELNIDLVWAIITNVYGPRETSSRFIKSTIERCLNKETLTFNSNGLQMYDFVYVEDAAIAFYQLAELGKNNQEYLIGSGEPKQLYKFVDEICEECNSGKAYFNMLGKVDSELPISIFSTFNTETDTGFKAQTPFREGIRKTKEWLEEWLKDD